MKEEKNNYSNFSLAELGKELSDAYNMWTKPDSEAYPYPKEGFVIDEDKSVKWNREQVTALRTAYIEREKELKDKKQERIREIEAAIYHYIAYDIGTTVEGAERVWSYLYGEYHSHGVTEMIAHYYDLAEMLSIVIHQKKG